ncbi:MAG: cell division protein FtsZ [Bacteroidetes bacterium]|jgi:cell division protein FtsZ|nr:cell division protein FtsZ [Bacteroidota bacterium]
MEGNTTEFTFAMNKGNSSIIKVIGVGGGGNNALKHMYEKGIFGVDFVICNTDAQTLDNNPVNNKVQLGISITEGLGAGADPEIGEKAAIESMEEIKSVLGQNTKMVFITAGMGGGTGTGAAPVIAKIAKEMGILTVGIVTVPFSFEGKRRLDQAELGLEKLRNNVDSLIVINNDKLRQQFGNLGFKQGFSKADEVLTNAAKGMAEVITGYFDVNIDFRDAKSVLQNSGTALMSTGTATGENKAEEAVRKALDSPLLNDNKITGAKNVLLLIRSGNEEATMDEIGIINDHIQREAGNTADIIFGVGTDEELGDAISVLVIATGFSKEHKKIDIGTEKIKYTLNDTIERRESPFKSREEKTETIAEETVTINEKNVFKLEDDFPNNGNSFSNSGLDQQLAVEQHSTTISEIETTEDFAFDDFGKEEPLDLFSYDNDRKSEQQTEIVFDFDTDEPFEKKEVQTITAIETQRNVVEFNFETQDTESIDIPAFKIKTQEILEEAEPIAKQESTIDTIQEVEPLVQTHGEFSFISKATTAPQKVIERKNKLKEFNSRYQTSENENHFETVPAFRRKNIAIEGSNPSEQQINSFASEDEKGKMQIRENKFLNKDVD